MSLRAWRAAAASLGALVGTAGLVGCGGEALSPPSPPVATRQPLPSRHRDARAELRRRAREAANAPSGGQGFAVETAFAEGRTGLRQSGRGALAVRQPDSVRLQIVGPAGKLALDVWIGPSGARVASPMMELIERTRPGEHRPGRPTSFLTFWMLHRFDGRLLAVTTDAAGRELWIVRGRDGALLQVHVDGDTIDVERHTPADDERVHHTGGACGKTAYSSAAGALTVEVVCTGALPPPKPRAFVDPDRPPDGVVP